MNFIIVTAFLITLTWARPQQFDQQLFPVKQFPTQQFPVRQFPNQQFPVQQFPGNPFLTGNNENNNQGNNNGNNFVTSTTNAPTTVTTASPQYLACLQSCPSTMEYNPICGSDNENYHNNGRLNCAQRCGKDVVSLRGGTCNPL